MGFTNYRGGPYRESRVVVQRFRIEQELVLEEWLWVVVLSESPGTQQVIMRGIDQYWKLPYHVFAVKSGKDNWANKKEKDFATCGIPSFTFAMAYAQLVGFPSRPNNFRWFKIPTFIGLLVT